MTRETKATTIASSRQFEAFAPRSRRVATTKAASPSTRRSSRWRCARKRSRAPRRSRTEPRRRSRRFLFRSRRRRTKNKNVFKKSRRRCRTARGSRSWRAATRERAPRPSRRWAKASSRVWTPRSSGDSPRCFAQKTRRRVFARVTLIRRRETVSGVVVRGASRWTPRARVSPWSRGATAAAFRAPRWTRRASPFLSTKRRRARRRRISRRRRMRRSTAPTLTSTRAIRKPTVSFAKKKGTARRGGGSRASRARGTTNA